MTEESPLEVRLTVRNAVAEQHALQTSWIHLHGQIARDALEQISGLHTYAGLKSATAASVSAQVRQSLADAQTLSAQQEEAASIRLRTFLQRVGKIVQSSGDKITKMANELKP